MNRRQVLATAGSALTLSLAGCSGSIPLGGFGEPEDGSQFELWLPTPDIFGQEEYHTPFRYFDVAALNDHSNEQIDTFLEHIELPRTDAQLSRAGLTLNDLDYFINAQMLFSVAYGDFDVDALGDELETQDFSRVPDEDDPSIYRIEDQRNSPAGIGLTNDMIATAGAGRIVDGTLLVGGVSEPATAVHELFEAGEQDSEQYGAVDPYIAALVDYLGAAETGFGMRGSTTETDLDRGEFANQEARGTEFDVNGETTDFTEVFVFEENVEPPVEDVEAWLDTEHPHQWGYETATYDHSIDVEDNVLLVSGTFDTDDGFTVA